MNNYTLDLLSRYECLSIWQTVIVPSLISPSGDCRAQPLQDLTNLLSFPRQIVRETMKLSPNIFNYNINSNPKNEYYSITSLYRVAI